MNATTRRDTSTAIGLRLWAPPVASSILRLTAISGMPMRLPTSFISIGSSTTSLFATTVRLALLFTSSTPFLSKMRPRGADVDMVLDLLDSACSLYSLAETSCIVQSFARSTAMIEPEKIPNPKSLDLKPPSVDMSDPPDALGAPPPMSNLKRVSPLPNRKNATRSAISTSARTMIMMTIGFKSRPYSLPRLYFEPCFA